MNAEQYLIEQAEKIELSHPTSKCRMRLAGALRAAADDIISDTDYRLSAYVSQAYRGKKGAVTVSNSTQNAYAGVQPETSTEIGSPRD